jgi:hypothetical protein
VKPAWALENDVWRAELRFISTQAGVKCPRRLWDLRSRTLGADYQADNQTNESSEDQGGSRSDDEVRRSRAFPPELLPDRPDAADQGHDETGHEANPGTDQEAEESRSLHEASIGAGSGLPEASGALIGVQWTGRLSGHARGTESLPRSRILRPR